MLGHFSQSDGPDRSMKLQARSTNTPSLTAAVLASQSQLPPNRVTGDTLWPNWSPQRKETDGRPKLAKQPRDICSCSQRRSRRPVFSSGCQDNIHFCAACPWFMACHTVYVKKQEVAPARCRFFCFSGATLWVTVGQGHGQQPTTCPTRIHYRLACCGLRRCRRRHCKLAS